MKFFILYMLTTLSTLYISAQDYSKYPAYDGELGLKYLKEASTFRIWSPPADGAELKIYKTGDQQESPQTFKLLKGNSGTWEIDLPGDWKGHFYTFRVNVNNKWNDEVPDPYAKATGINGIRAAVIDLNETNPAGWQNDKSPAFSKNNYPSDAIIYELHVRDASIDSNSGIKHKGKFLGLTEKNTRSKQGLSTGLDHLKELGVTHIHILPFYDYNSVDERRNDQYNWGYDPLNYNVPEGSYSTNAADPKVRIRELKEMIASLHKNGIRVIMDVVYNHTALTEKSNFNQLVPGYYYRQNKDGSFSDATACGNETASERPMMRKFILESVLYWLKEYHVDGFRFDLMGVHDIETMNIISNELHKIRPDILLYGEGWTAGASPLPDSLRALKKNAHLLNGIAVFSDDIRDGIKGSVFDHADRGFVSGKPGMEESIKFGVVGATEHPQLNYAKVNYSDEPYSSGPWNVINYSECHDNNTLWDKLMLSAKNATEEDKKKMYLLANTIVLTSQGIPFLHAGGEFIRTKYGVENSYKSSDSINAIQWKWKSDENEMYRKIRSLIKMRKDHPAFRMTTAQQIRENIHFLESRPGIVSYTINGNAVDDSWENIFVSFNGNSSTNVITLPEGTWIDPKTKKKYSGNIQIEKYSAVVLKKK